MIASRRPRYFASFITEPVVMPASAGTLTVLFTQ